MKINNSIYLKNNSQEEKNENIKYHLISSFSEFYEKIAYHKKESNFILIINSITFFADNYINEFQKIINLLWSVVYDCNSTVITVNHYKTNRDFDLIPRLGSRWEFFITCQILFTFKKNEIVFTVRENKALS